MLTIWRRVFIRDEWSALNSTSNFTDQQLEETLRNTALYKTLNILQRAFLSLRTITAVAVSPTAHLSPSLSRFVWPRPDDLRSLSFASPPLSPEIDSTATALNPSQVLLTSGSSPAELAARFASVRADEIELLWTDLKREDEKLRSSLDESRGGKLSVWAREVARLAAAQEEAANEGEEDGEMTGESRWSFEHVYPYVHETVCPAPIRSREQADGRRSGWEWKRSFIIKRSRKIDSSFFSPLSFQSFV
jgi:hypothetical protein